MLPFLVPVLFTFYIQGVLKKLKKFGCQKVKIWEPQPPGTLRACQGLYLLTHIRSDKTRVGGWPSCYVSYDKPADRK
jgi:hypothetical protein